MARGASQRANQQAFTQAERAALKKRFEEVTPPECADCGALAFLALRLTTMSVSRGLPADEAIEEYKTARAKFCPRLGEKALKDTCRVDDEYFEPGSGTKSGEAALLHDSQ